MPSVSWSGAMCWKRDDRVPLPEDRAELRALRDDARRWLEWARAAREALLSGLEPPPEEPVDVDLWGYMRSVFATGPVILEDVDQVERIERSGNPEALERLRWANAIEHSIGAVESLSWDASEALRNGVGKDAGDWIVCWQADVAALLKRCPNTSKLIEEILTREGILEYGGRVGERKYRVRMTDPVLHDELKARVRRRS